MNSFNWYWFFSSFSQCGAAIIGIIGGFVIYKLIDSNSSLDKVITEYEILVNEFQNLKKRINRINFEEYYYNFLWSSPLIWNLIQDKRLINLDDDHLINLLYKHLNGLYKSKEIILRQIKIIISHIPSFKTVFENPETRNIKEKVAKIMRENIDEQIINSGDLISKFLLNKKKLFSLKNDYRILKRMIIFMFISLIALVIYPLHFLPSNLKNEIFYTFNLKEIIYNSITFTNILLFVFASIMASFLFYFLKLIRINNSIIDKSMLSYKDYIIIENYSESFKAISVDTKYL